MQPVKLPNDGIMNAGTIKIGKSGEIIFQFKNYHHIIDGETELYYAHMVERKINELNQALQKANEENERLKRALWLDKAARANAEWGHWATIWFCDTRAILNINKSSVSQDPYRCTITRNAAEWRNLWAEVERKCRAKAEEYK